MNADLLGAEDLRVLNTAVARVLENPVRFNSETQAHTRAIPAQKLADLPLDQVQRGGWNHLGVNEGNRRE